MPQPADSIDRRTPGLRRTVCRTLHVLYVCCVLGLLLLPAHRYGWMRELDAGFGGALPEDGSGNRWLGIAVLVAAAVLAQLISACLARTRRRRWLALVLGAAVVMVALWRFGLP